MCSVQHSKEVHVPTNTTISKPFLLVDQENLKSKGSENDDYGESILRNSQFSQYE